MTGCGPVVWQITDDDDWLWTCCVTDYWWMNVPCPQDSVSTSTTQVIDKVYWITVEVVLNILTAVILTANTDNLRVPKSFLPHLKYRLWTMRDRRLPPLLNWILPYSDLLSHVRWFETDVSGIYIDPIFKGQNIPERRFLITLRRVITQKTGEFRSRNACTLTHPPYQLSIALNT
jgi:hypothetical protein